MARAFVGRLTSKRCARVAELLDVLADLGHLRRGQKAGAGGTARPAALYGARAARAVA